VVVVVVVIMVRIQGTYDAFIYKRDISILLFLHVIKLSQKDLVKTHTITLTIVFINLLVIIGIEIFSLLISCYCVSRIRSYYVTFPFGD